MLTQSFNILSSDTMWSNSIFYEDINYGRMTKKTALTHTTPTSHFIKNMSSFSNKTNLFAIQR